MTVVILILAANTAFADLPHMMAMMANDGYLPSRLISRGSRLNYTNGIVFMAISAGALVLAFGANQHALMPLFASGIFISFILHQLGMLCYWTRRKARFWLLNAGLNCVTLLVTAVTFVVLILTSFLGGAWITLLGIVLLTALMLCIRRHYRRVQEELSVGSDDEVRAMFSATHSGKAILPMRSLNRAFIKAYNCARDMGFSEIEFFYTGSREEDAIALGKRLEELGFVGKFVYEITEYRDTEDVLIRHIEMEERKLAHHQHLTILLPNLVTMNPAKQNLHNETSRVLLHRMARYRYVYIFQVPYVFE